MKNLFILGLFFIASSAIAATDYKCYSSKYPKDMEHFFEEGYVLLKVEEESVHLQYFYVNKVANETTLQFESHYELGGIQGGRGQLKGLIIAKNGKAASDGEINTIWFEPGLINNSDLDKSGLVGKFVFKGQHYKHDWNLCYNVK